MNRYLIERFTMTGPMFDGLRDIMVQSAYNANSEIASVMSLEYVMEHATMTECYDDDAGVGSALISIDVTDPDHKAFLKLSNESDYI